MPTQPCQFCDLRKSNGRPGPCAGCADATDKRLRAAAHKNYGRPCTNMLCGGRGDERMIVLYSDIEAERDETMGGTWIAARLWIPDEE